MQIHIPDPARAKAFFQNKIDFTLGPVELEHLIKSGDPIVVVDVRDAEDYAKSHVPGAINVPKPTWDNPQGLQKDKTNVLYCYTQTCHLAAKAGVAFAGKGYPVMEMEGGFAAWQKGEFETEGEPANRLKKPGERMAGRRQ